MIAYRAMLDVPAELLRYLTRLLAAERRRADLLYALVWQRQQKQAAAEGSLWAARPQQR